MPQAGAKKKASSNEATAGAITATATATTARATVNAREAISSKGNVANKRVADEQKQPLSLDKTRNFTLIDSNRIDDDDDIVLCREVLKAVTTSSANPTLPVDTKLTDSPDCPRAPRSLRESNNNNILEADKNSSVGLSPAPLIVAATSAALSSAFGMTDQNASGRPAHQERINNSNNRRGTSDRASNIQTSSMAATATPLTSISNKSVDSQSGDTKNLLDNQQGPHLSGTPTVPSYTSIFMQSTRQQATSVRQTEERRLPIRKQLAQTDLDEAAASHKTGANKKNGQYNNPTYRSSITKDDNSYDDDEEDEEQAFDERSPFSSKSGKFMTDKRSNHSPVESQASPSKHSMLAFEHLQNNNQQSKNPNHTKISFSGANMDKANNGQVCFNSSNNNTCQAAYCHSIDMPHGRKFDWMLETSGCAKCICQACQKKRKLFAAATDGSSFNLSRQMILNGSSPCSIGKPPLSRTDKFHLVLKSIILILLTLLLLMIFFGIIMASHYLPHAIDKAINASRSFNVTIAGR